MQLNERLLNRSTLRRQLLQERAPMSVVDATTQVTALQAQNPMSPYIALWNRVAGFEPGDVDRAFTESNLVKATMMRITLHVVAKDDHPLFRAAMMPSLRAAGFYDRRFKELPMTIEDADALVPALVAATAQPRTRTEIEAVLAEGLGEEPPAGLWRALRFSAPWRHAPGDHPWAFGEPARFVACDETADHEAGLDHLIRSYLRAFGPAKVRDIAQFTLLTNDPIKGTLERLGDEVVWHGDVRSGHVDLADSDLGVDVPAPPRLLGMWDNLLLAYADRSRIIPDELRSIVIRRNGDVLPTVLIDGYVAGVWRPVDDGIEITPLHEWSTDVWDALEEEAKTLWAMIAARDPTPYSRHDRWWSDLPTADRRVFAATV